jgi:exopolysaccharide biosynthesis polyprenyl glycosylphosphotransferase
VDRIVLSHEGLDEQDLADVLRLCRKESVKVSILPQVSDLLGPSVELDSVEGVTVLGVNPPALSRSSRALKRAMDVVGAATIILLLLPLLLAIAVIIKATSRGPVLFSQERIGLGGRRFKLIKFRTMVQDAEEKMEELLEQSRDPDWLLVDEDPRITRVGRILRSTSLDELPQLWNVLIGRMSLVGPRPLQERDDANVLGWSRSRLDLTPGITGYWQVLGRTRIPFQEMLKLDYLYVANWSLWGDVRLIAHTLPVVLTRRGAN